MGWIYDTIERKNNSHNVFVAIARSALVLKINLSTSFDIGDKDIIELMKLAYAHYYASTIIMKIRAGGNNYLDVPLHELEFGFIDGLTDLASNKEYMMDFHKFRLGYEELINVIGGLSPDAFEKQLMDKIILEERHLKQKMKKMFKKYNDLNTRIKDVFKKAFKESIKGWEKSLRTSFKSAEKRADELEKRIENTSGFAGTVEKFFISIFFQEPYLKKLKNIYIMRENQLIGYP